MKRPPIVCVVWEDARTVYEQLELGQVASKVQLSRRETVGFLIHKDRARLIVAGTFDPAEKKHEANQTPDEDGGADFTCIPRAWAASITTMVPAEKSEEEDGEPTS